MAAERERGKGGQEIATLQQQVQQLQRVLGEQGENQLRIEDELSAAADDKGALQRLDAQLAEQARDIGEISGRYWGYIGEMQSRRPAGRAGPPQP